MINLKKIAIATLSLIALAGVSANAQIKLPESHDAQHSDLLAAQRPIAADIQLVNTMKFLEELRHDEYLDESIFGEYWESEMVNPYGAIEIPKTKDLDVSGFVMPLDRYTISSHYGYRKRFRRNHYGIDMAAPVGDTVKCAFDGKVRIVKNQGRRKGYGLYVVVRHDNGMETVYGHLSKFLVTPDQRVKAGEPIALSGNTGRSTGPHLHFETRFLGVAINPDAIIDFENRVPHKDIFTFDKATHSKSQSYKPTTTTARKTTTASRKRKTTTRKTTAKKSR